MKKLLLLCYLFLFFVEPVLANDELQFYFTSESVSDMWITRVTKDITMSDHPYILRRKSDKSYVYCLEPVVMLNQTDDYKAYFENENVLNLTDDQWKRISELAYFGYQYPGHEDKKWYGITQFLIWKTVAPDMTMYFAAKKNGKKVSTYDKEIAELESYLKNYHELEKLDKEKLTFRNQEEWQNYLKDNPFLQVLKRTRASSYHFELPKNGIAFGADIVYYHKNGQNVYHPGELKPLGITLEVEFLKGRIHLQKKNEENVFLSKQNSLKGAQYGIYKDGILLETLITDEEGRATSNPLEYGYYTVKELKAPNGYLIDNQEYTIYLEEEDYSFEVKEKQIEKDIRIQKWYGSGTYQVEPNATFEIYQGDTLVLTVTTDSSGIAEAKLPYGDYRIHQVTGKKGYEKIKDYYFTVDEKFEKVIELFNKEIIEEVPNTGIYRPFVTLFLQIREWGVGLYAS